MKHRTVLARFAFAALLAGLLSGCFGLARSRVDGTVGKDGVVSMNIISVVREGKRMTLKSYGRLAGKARTAPDDAHLVWSQNTAWGELRVLAWEPEATAVRDTLGLGQDDAGTAAIAARSLGHSLEVFPALVTRRTVINLYAAPFGSGRRVQAAMPISTDALTASIVVGLDVNDRKTPQHWWLLIVDTVSHELLHVQHALAGKEVDALNDETAAYLTGVCAQIWLTLDLQKRAEMTLDVSHPFIQQVFPGISEGRWAPRVDALTAYKGMDTSGIGRSVAYATIYHKYAIDGAFDLGDEARVKPILEECSRYGVSIPQFLQTETLPEAY